MNKDISLPKEVDYSIGTEIHGEIDSVETIVYHKDRLVLGVTKELTHAELAKIQQIIDSHDKAAVERAREDAETERHDLKKQDHSGMSIPERLRRLEKLAGLR